ncbi:sulfite exporter TauE/SafE family protein [Rhodobium gokarnense]|uniref:Probable membrane transporter protein n=1 Tax=Rhodobium gokarnense TaxID=364296 RepID=A0ABT3H6Y6_9HYPH|nr:sulfite exporter TauE/SafE family protein [Rhodobium gokarnense]MCW2306152.1 putative membrane protein YfcA [Rhodobium gokarnense]
MISDPMFYWAAVPAVLLVGLSKGGFGGSFALLGTPLMALVIPPLQAAGIMLPILVAMDIVALTAYRRRFDKRTIAILVPAGVIGVTIGWLTAAMITAAHVRLIVGTIGLWFTLDYLLKRKGERAPAEHNIAKGGFWGTVAGFTSFVSHAGGPPFQMYALPLKLEPVLFAGTSAIFFASVNAVKLVPYFALGQFSTQNLTTSAVLLPLAPIGVMSGVWLVKRIPMKPFYRIVYSAVFLVSCKLIWDGISELALR